MNRVVDPIGESSRHQLAAVFESRSGALRALRQLAAQTSMDGKQIRVLDSESTEAERQLLPESHGIERTLVRSHIVFGAIGAWFGILLFLVLNASGLPFVADNPIAAFLVLLHVSTLSGLLIGGLISLRPDQVPYIRIAREALRARKYVVVVHAKSAAELGQARGVVEGPAEQVVASA